MNHFDPAQISGAPDTLARTLRRCLGHLQQDIYAQRRRGRAAQVPSSVIMQIRALAASALRLAYNRGATDASDDAVVERLHQRHQLIAHWTLEKRLIGIISPAELNLLARQYSAVSHARHFAAALRVGLE